MSVWRDAFLEAIDGPPIPGDVYRDAAGHEVLVLGRFLTGDDHPFGSGEAVVVYYDVLRRVPLVATLAWWRGPEGFVRYRWVATLGEAVLNSVLSGLRRGVTPPSFSVVWSKSTDEEGVNVEKETEIGRGEGVPPMLPGGG